MLKPVLLPFAGVLFAMSAAFCQSRPQVWITSDERCSHAILKGTVNMGNSYIRTTHRPELLQVCGNAGMHIEKRLLQNLIVKSTQFASIILEDRTAIGLANRISRRIFGMGNAQLDNQWIIYLTDTKSYELDLDYGTGNTSIDLAGLSVNRLKVRTGSTDVNIFYGFSTPNKVKMDSFMVKVDVGSIDARQLDLCRTKNIITEVGFGGTLLDFGDAIPRGAHVTSNVGTGILVVVLPEYRTPMKVKINNSWLCSLDLHPSLKKVSDDTFVNSAFLRKEPDPIYFEIDVPMGEVIFKQR